MFVLLLLMVMVALQVFDATNTTRERRRLIHNIVVEKMGYKLLFVESVCNDPKIVQATIKEVKVNSPDYKDVHNESVLNDFLLRIQHYEVQYQTLDEVLEAHFSFMKIFNTGNLNLILFHRSLAHCISAALICRKYSVAFDDIHRDGSLSCSLSCYSCFMFIYGCFGDSKSL